ncbi:D-alanyl-D-alanine carboxypeptidase family protein [Sporomusa sphaeroides]|uniref:serine-type D-Ala-D-Ala carboxypeptidase n=1 Tax=Sporomusa sphaeroides DSM 2875 TaxID=1337886 RepID=A0ABP2C269_9FIRM|nr:D-alanyl-D-alanine carboxypeptidase family protein [Sporomusa sphaeroides]OLS58290.1 D-alanyl-D-alanine carboxypeptidase DacF precursor [Sporomusa sphaeroides DSM 2875]CVK17523.1 D-alanyl-D-alanine carboxypeptidase DacF precursor [Sporomusa sphaeroides DSM 2875]
MIRKTVLVTLLFLLLAGSTAFGAPANPQSAVQLQTSAVSAVLMDENGTILFEKDSHKRLPPASVTKIMTLLLAVEAVEQGRIQLTDEIFTSETAWRQGGSQIWLEPGEKMSVKEILTAVAVVSANDAAVALMEHIYGSEAAAVEAMNKRAEALGLADTHFNNVNGLPTTDHYMSAYDAALIAKEATTHPLYMEMCGIKEAWLRDGKNWLVNTNKLLWWYKGGDGLKTGWTEEAKYCFVGTAKRDGLRLISAVFATPEPRSHLRESMKLLDWGFANYTAVPIVTQGTVVERLKVNKGIEKEIQLVAAQDLNLIVGKGQNKNLQKKIVADSSVNAPIEAGQKCGELIVIKDGKEMGKVDLIAEKAVPKAGLIRIFQNMITNLFSISN